MLATLRKPAFVRIYLIPLVSNTAASMTGAIAILYALDLGASILQVNLITAIQSTMGILLLVPFGILSDRVGRRPMIVFSRTMSVFGALVRAFATDANHLLIASFVGGFAGGVLYFSVLLSMIADIAKPKEQHEGVSTLLLFNGLGMLLGPIVCSLLLTLPQMTLRSIYHIGVVAQICTLLYVIVGIRETTPKTASGARIVYRIAIRDLMSRKDFQGLLLAIFFYAFSDSVLRIYVPIYSRLDLNLSDAEIASFSTYRSLSNMLIRFFLATILTRFPIGLLYLTGLTLGGIVSLACVFAPNYLSIALILFFSGMANGLQAVSKNTLTARKSTARNRGVANSLSHLSESIAHISTTHTSPIAYELGLTPVFLISGMTALLATTPLLTILKGER